MRVCGNILGPDRDIGLYRPAISTLHVTDALRFGPFGQKVLVMSQKQSFRVPPDMQKNCRLGLEQWLDAHTSCFVYSNTFTNTLRGVYGQFDTSPRRADMFF